MGLVDDVPPPSAGQESAVTPDPHTGLGFYHSLGDWFPEGTKCLVGQWAPQRTESLDFTLKPDLRVPGTVRYLFPKSRPRLVSSFTINTWYGSA